MPQKKQPLRVTYAMAVHDEKETARVVKVLDEHRTLMGREVKEFEADVAEQFGKKYGIMVNSGSSANLLAVELMDLPEGSEVITPLLTFATTVAPLVQHGLVPVFVDVELGTYQINVDHIEKLITKKTKALFIPLLLGNVPDLAKLRSIAKKHDLIFVEDSCDTLGATFKDKPSGTYSDISTTSFYGSHIITAGGTGGMILMSDEKWRDLAKVLRGWGRSSSFFSESEDIRVRFGRKIEGIEYDGKFIFDEIGYNFLPAEINAAFGNAQLKKLPKFRKAREHNFARLYKFFSKYEEFFILPKQDERVRTQWLAFPLTIREGAPFSRLEVMTYLEENNMQTRPIFSGNILKQPAFKNIVHKGGKSFPVTDHIMKNGFLIGCHHGMQKEHLDRVEELFTEFLKMHK
jgi:CDP-4-dehydro-6-deoxyglucose reductase, E1